MVNAGCLERGAPFLSREGLSGSVERAEVKRLEPFSSLQPTAYLRCASSSVCKPAPEAHRAALMPRASAQRTPAPGGP
eukprot:10974292-Alexandrium_andersonii.AAC.1